MIFRATILALLPTAVLAQDCEQATTQADMNRCAAEALETADAALNAAWGDAMARMHEIDDGLPAERQGAADALRAAQRSWLVVRDKGCEAAAWAYDGGTIRPMVQTQCRVEATETRTEVLRDMAKRPDQ